MHKQHNLGKKVWNKVFKILGLLPQEEKYQYFLVDKIALSGAMYADMQTSIQSDQGLPLTESLDTEEYKGLYQTVWLRRLCILS